MPIDKSVSEINISKSLEQITQDVHKKINTEKTDETVQSQDFKIELPYYKKEEIEAKRQKNSDLRESILENTSIIYKNLASDKDRYTYLQQKENKNLDDEQESLRLQKNIERTSTALNNIESKSEEMYQLFKETLNNQNKDAMENFTDSKTGLYLMPVIVEDSQQRIEKWISDNDLSPRGYKIMMTDMMLFHAANQRLGTTGLDDRLFTCMQGQIALSKYIDHQNNLYSPLTSLEIENNKYLQNYFEKNTESRKKIDLLKNKGVQISPFRVNAGGGDEFGYCIKFTQELNPEEEIFYEQLAKESIDHIIESTSLSTNFDVITEDTKERELDQNEILDRQEQYKFFCNSISHLKFKSRPERNIILTSEQIEMNNFLDSLRNYFTTEQQAKLGQEILNPKYNITMEHAFIDFSGNLPTLEDALMLSIYGKDSYLIHHKYNKMGFYDKDGNIKERKIDKYTTDLAIRVKSILSLEDQNNPQSISKIIKEVFISDSIKNIFTITNEEVNTDGKHNKKRKVFLDAVFRDIKSIITVGVSEQSGRALYTPQNNTERMETINIIKNHYKKLIEKNNQDNNLLKLKQDLEDKNIVL